MDRKQLTTGLSEIGLGVILFITTLELPSVLPSGGMMEVFVFFIRVLSYISIVIGVITTLMVIIPEGKKMSESDEERKVIWEKKRK
jgi:hypothetical protein